MAKKERRGWLIWQGAPVTWEYQAFESSDSLRLRPHFILTITHPTKDESVTWDNIEVNAPGDVSIKGITDFTKLPPALMANILDNAVAKLYEDESLTRISPPGGFLT